MRIHDACRKHGLFVPGGSRSRRASVCLTACGHIRQPDACRENTDRAAVELHYRRRRTLAAKLIVRPPRRPVNMSRPSIQIGLVSIHTVPFSGRRVARGQDRTQWISTSPAPSRAPGNRLTYNEYRQVNRIVIRRVVSATTNRARPFLIRRCLAFYHPTGPELLRQKRKGARGAVSSSSDVGQERIGLRGASIGAALQAQQGARSGGGYAPSIDRCARSVLLLTRRSCSRADQLCAGTRTKHQWKTFHSH